MLPTMVDLDKNEINARLSNLVKLKERAALRIAHHMKLDPREIFYEYMRGNLPNSGVLKDDTSFFFHGLGCSVKNDSEHWKVELEFGPQGAFQAFDKYTLCNHLGFSVDECDDAISDLIKCGFIRLVDEELFKLINEQPDYTAWISEKQEIDATVADRYILVKEYLGTE